ncbi:PLC-like phosphodiesterase [Melampsora americana]|nr:PLC-like phosphodiesterase [Melampsora americana]
MDNNNLQAHPTTTTSSQSNSHSIHSFDSTLMHNVEIPNILQLGTEMVKVSAKKTIRIKVSLNHERGQIVWESKKGGSLNIESIREIRFGQDAAYYRAQFKIHPEYEPVWFTIIYISKKSTYKMLHLFAIQPDDFLAWKLTLERILEFRRELLGGLNHMRKRQAYWLKQHWIEANTNPDPKLNFKETVDLCRRLNISIPESSIRANFNMADSDQKGYLDFTDFQRFVKLVKRRTDLDAIFQKITSGKDTMSVEDFIIFMQTVQCSPLSTASLQSIYAKFLDEPVQTASNSNPELSTRSKLMNVESFNSFLQSSDNSAFNEAHLRVCQDMTHPICDYFISSSHNTYLVGNQLKGESTVEGYIRALQEGCRSVELDCWDGDSGEPVIYHGRTLTSKLLVSEALKAISKYAFAATPYPLILSLEVHCQPAQQDRLAELLKAHLGDALVDQRLDGVDPGILPSPQQLMYRILIKAKKPTSALNQSGQLPELSSEADQPASATTTTSATSGSSTSSDSDLKRTYLCFLPRIEISEMKIFVVGSTTNSLKVFSNASSRLGHRFKRISTKVIPPQTSTADQIPTTEVLSVIPPDSTFSPPPSQSMRKLPSEPITHALSDIAVYTIGVKARGFNKITKYDSEHCVSLSERAVNKFLKSGSQDLIGHTRSHLTRAYPAATRVFSGNFLPHRFWGLGIQLVAFNWQTFDLGMELNQALFNLNNGRAGYVLKPEVLRVKGKEKDAATRVHKYEIEIEIISAQQLPRSSGSQEDDSGPDAFVEVQVIGSSCTSNQIPSSMKRRTKVVKGNGLNPIFDEKFKIPFDVRGGMLELSFLRILVCDDQLGENDEILGRISMGLDGLQPGYRHLPLIDEAGHPLMFASLFIKSRIREVLDDDDSLKRQDE